ncbi:MAG: hypothetical protein GX300_02030 [Tissierellia bacterium]|nr:hypothetical protein [Tissierellia bacterium]
MKKTNLFIILVLVLALALSACTSKDNGNVDNNQVGDQVEGSKDSQTDDPIVNEDESSNERVMKMPSFTLKNIDGEEISSDIFGDYDLTIISIWQST